MLFYYLIPNSIPNLFFTQPFILLHSYINYHNAPHSYDSGSLFPLHHPNGLHLDLGLLLAHGYLFLDSGTINSKTATYSATYNYTISLSPPMNSSTYSCAMGLSALFQDNLSTLKYNYFFTDLTVKAATSLTVRLYHSETVLTNPFINVRYLLV